MMTTSAGPPVGPAERARRQSARRAGTDRALRHAGREPADGFLLVDLQRRQPGSPRVAQAVRDVDEAALGRTARVVRASTRARAPLHPPPHENRPLCHRGFAGQEGSGWCTDPQTPRQAALYQQSVDELKTTALAARRASSAADSSCRSCCGSNKSRIIRRTGSATTSGSSETAANQRLCDFRPRLWYVAPGEGADLHAIPEMTGPLSTFLASVFRRTGLVLHGGTPLAQRRTMVEQLQQDERTPFFVLRSRPAAPG